jgi:phosphoribosyl-ATP pyrophosphohydrolase / phosphoribosyl-AMP cyclohydrolase / histidinol dehydrogenase
VHDAPEKSYTNRLFNDLPLLNNKIVEEANELCDAVSKEDIAWEAADLLYFALVKCVSRGVTLADIEHNLNVKAKKVTRRPGDAKIPLSDVKSASEDKVKVEHTEVDKQNSRPDYHMRVVKKDVAVDSEYRKLLLRPIIDTEKIMERVRPICEKVRQDGDSAVLGFTKRFDNVDMDSVVINAPFDTALMELEPRVKSAIDLAYSNVLKFHEAQLEKEPLVVETMRGVTCTRFYRPIERVGLYVPGGTAVLPSSTLMLGVPAKV